MSAVHSRWRLVATALLAAASGCGSFGPARPPPAMPASDQYAAVPIAASLPTAGGVTQRLVPGGRPVREWWKAYHCPALDTLVAEGLAQSPSLAAAKQTLQAARQQLRGQIGQNVLPDIDASFAPTRQRGLGIPILPQYRYFDDDIFVAEVKASYTFDFFGASVLADRSLARQVQAQALELEATRRALAANLVTAAIHAASLEAQVAATERLVALGEARAAQMRARFTHGSASRDEMLAAEQDAANAAATLPALRAQALAVRHAQAVLLGRRPDQAPAPLPLVDLTLPESVPLSVPTDLLRERPDIRAAAATVRAAADAAGAAAAALFPSLTLSAAYGRGGFDWSSLSSPGGALWSVGASLTQPIFRGGALVARKRQYQAQYEAAVADYRRTVLAAFQNVADDLVALEEDANTVIQTERAADAARAQSDNSAARYRLGSTPYYATLTAGQQYENALIQLTRARAARLADTAALLDAMGAAPDVDGPGTARNY